jgi:CheY-like chemotaxis protein
MSAKSNPTEDTVEILAVDDSPTQVERLRYILEQRGYRVTVANDGRQALACLNGKKPALVISDIVMPEMNGYQLCQRIKAEEHTRDIPVILLTSLSDPADVLEGLACGAASFITKPYSEDYLLAHVERTLADRSSRPSGRADVDVEIPLAGKSRIITVDPQQMLSLLLSTYEAAIHRNAELVQTQDELNSLNEHLEDLVEERTAALSAEIAERKRVEEAKRIIEEKFRNVIENIFKFVPEGLLVLTDKLNVFRRNKALEDLVHQYAEKLDYTEDELADIVNEQVKIRVANGEKSDIIIARKQR